MGLKGWQGVLGKRMGQIKNAVVDENYNVLVGNGLVLALQKMGVEKVSVLIKENLSDNETEKTVKNEKNMNQVHTTLKNEGKRWKLFRKV